MRLVQRRSHCRTPAFLQRPDTLSDGGDQVGSTLYILLSDIFSFSAGLNMQVKVLIPGLL